MTGSLRNEICIPAVSSSIYINSQSSIPRMHFYVQINWDHYASKCRLEINKKGDHVIPAAKFLLKKLSWIQLLNRTHCLPIELRKIGQDKTYEIKIKTPLLTFITYFEDDILRVYQRLKAKNADLRLQHCKSPQTIYYFSGKPTNSFHWNFLQVLFSNSEKNHTKSQENIWISFSLKKTEHTETLRFLNAAIGIGTHFSHSIMNILTYFVIMQAWVFGSFSSFKPA